MTRRLIVASVLVASLPALPYAAPPTPADIPLPAPPKAPAEIKVVETDEAVTIETDSVLATINKKGFVTGIAPGSFTDKKTSAKEAGFGLHIMDFLLAPGWRDDGYERNPAWHGNIPKHYVEGPQICTQAKQMPVEIIRGEQFVGVRLRYTYTRPGAGYKAGSTWEQTLIFQPGVRYVLAAEKITSANDVPKLFYRLDMPGHIRHGGKDGDTFEQVYLSYLPKPIPAAEFDHEFAPDARFLYNREEGHVPERMIRAYQTKPAGKPGPWLAGMTLDPAAVSQAWCHQRGYVCLIEELHGRPIKAGETIGSAYIVGWFDDIPEMEKVYDRFKGTTGIDLTSKTFTPRPPLRPTGP